MRKSQMPTNVGNFLKMPESGFARWRPQIFFEGWNKDGTARTREGFKNTLTDREIIPPDGWNADLGNLSHGDIACAITATDKFRVGYEGIQWGEPLGEVVKQEKGRTVIRYD